MKIDLKAIQEKWLRQCGACDAGLPMSCVCPEEDYRPTMLELVREVERLRKVIPDREHIATIPGSRIAALCEWLVRPNGAHRASDRALFESVGDSVWVRTQPYRSEGGS